MGSKRSAIPFPFLRPGYAQLNALLLLRSCARCTHGLVGSGQWPAYRVFGETSTCMLSKVFGNQVQLYYEQKRQVVIGYCFNKSFFLVYLLPSGVWKTDKHS